MLRASAPVIATAAAALALGPLLIGGCGGGSAHLAPGERLVRARCGACHAPPRKGAKSAAQMQAILESHAATGRGRLDAEQRRQVAEALSPASPRPSQRP